MQCGDCVHFILFKVELSDKREGLDAVHFPICEHRDPIPPETHGLLSTLSLLEIH